MNNTYSSTISINIVNVSETMNALMEKFNNVHIDEEGGMIRWKQHNELDPNYGIIETRMEFSYPTPIQSFEELTIFEECVTRLRKLKNVDDWYGVRFDHQSIPIYVKYLDNLSLIAFRKYVLSGSISGDNFSYGNWRKQKGGNLDIYPCIYCTDNDIDVYKMISTIPVSWDELVYSINPE